MAWSFVSKAKVSAVYGISTTELQDEWSDWAEGLIKDYMGVDYIGTTSSVTETHDGDGTNLMVVNKPPIASVISLSISDVSVSSADYKVYDSYVKLVATSNPLLVTVEQDRNLYFPVGEQNVSITYVSGYSSVPTKVEWCAAQMIGTIAQFSKRKGVDSSLQFSSPTEARGERVRMPKLYLTLNDIMKNVLGRRHRFN